MMRIPWSFAVSAARTMPPTSAVSVMPMVE
jgi:hypothetical protein